jgi:hypothetical protein
MMDAFLRWAFGKWWAREEEPEDYPDGTDWQPVGSFRREEAGASFSVALRRVQLLHQGGRLSSE